MKRFARYSLAAAVLIAATVGVATLQPSRRAWRPSSPGLEVAVAGLAGSPFGGGGGNVWTLGTSGSISFGTANTTVSYSAGFVAIPNLYVTNAFTSDAALSGPSLSLTGLNGTGGSGTGITINSTSQIKTYVHKITVAETALTAAATTQDITIWTLPAKTRLLRIVVADVTGFTGGGLTAMTVMCGPSGGSAVYLVAGSVFASNAVLGDVAAEIGSSLTAATVADIPSMTATQAIVCRFTSTTANVVAATAGTASFYIEAVTYP